MYQGGVCGLLMNRRCEMASARWEEIVQFIVLGNIGSDAGYWVYRDGQWEHVDGWGVDALREVQAGLAVLRASTQLRTPELARSVAELVTKAIVPELAEHARGGQTVIIA